ncbi:MAG TPA: hypothetical protein VKT83_19480 [bacterium]|nr:hypothetical protein [bacterium]
MSMRLDAERTPLMLALGLAGLLGVFLVTQPPAVVGATLAAVVVLVLAFFNRMLALYAVAAAAAVSPEIIVGGTSTHLRVDAVLMVVFAAVWLLKLAVSSERETSPLDRVVVAYVLVGFASILWGLYIGTAHLTLADKDLSAPLHFLERIEFAFLFFVLVDTLRTADDVRNFTYIMMAALVALSAYSVQQYFSGASPIAAAPGGAPVHEPGWASLLNVTFALSLLPAVRRPGKVLLLAIVCFSLAVLPLTLGRNFMVSTMFVIAFIGVTQQRWLLAFLPLPLLSWMLYPKVFANRVLSLQHLFSLDPTGTQTAGASLLSRVIAPVSYTMLSLGYSPLLGFGLAAQPLGAMDSEYVTQLYYTGVIGFVVFIALGSRLFRMSIQTVRAARDPVHCALARAYLLILIAYGFFSALSASISASRAGTFFFIIAGMTAALHRSVTQSTSPGQAPPSLAERTHDDDSPT